MFSKFKKNKNKSSMDGAINDFFRLKDASYTTPPKPEFPIETTEYAKEVTAYLEEKFSSNTMTAIDYFIQDALNNLAYTKLAQALIKELGCNDVKFNGISNFQWNNLFHSVITTLSLSNYCDKKVKLALAINCKTPNTNSTTILVTVIVGDDKASLSLDPIPNMETDASFIYENFAKKVKYYLVPKRYNVTTF